MTITEKNAIIQEALAALLDIYQDSDREDDKKMATKIKEVKMETAEMSPGELMRAIRLKNCYCDCGRQAGLSRQQNQ